MLYNIVCFFDIMGEKKILLLTFPKHISKIKNVNI